MASGNEASACNRVDGQLSVTKTVQFPNFNNLNRPKKTAGQSDPKLEVSSTLSWLHDLIYCGDGGIPGDGAAAIAPAGARNPCEAIAAGLIAAWLIANWALEATSPGLALSNS